MNHPPPTSAGQRAKTSTLCEAFCRKERCESDSFVPRVFWRTIYPHARLLAYVVGHRADHFVADRALIEYCGCLTSRREIEAELNEFVGVGRQGFFRRRCRLRVSAARLKKLAARYLPS